MLQLVDEVFDVRNDPEQLDVNEEVIKHLQELHSATLSEYADENGPAAWILMIPTTKELMEQFLQNAINEQQLLDKTPVNAVYTAVYLCSALVLPEYRNKGIAKKLSIDAINSIKMEHPVEYLFVWPFSKYGELLAERIAQATGLELKKK